jgi:hypothetical protein
MNQLKDQFQNMVSGITKGTTPKESSQESQINPNRVLLDVGGVHFSTTTSTLTSVPDSMLGRMFSGKYPVKVCSEDGRVFIDRDGTHFHYLLSFLRDPANYKFKTHDKAVRDEVQEEAKYYGLEELMFTVEANAVPENLNWLDNKTIKIPKFSSTYSGFPVTNVLDPSQTYWLSESGKTTNQWMLFEFPTKVFVNKIMMKVSSFECTCKDWQVQVSEDEDQTNWSVVKQFQTQCGNQNQGEQMFDGFEVWSKFIRLFYINNWGPGGGSYILVTDLKFFGAPIED